jgi:hypothetical protein
MDAFSSRNDWERLIPWNDVVGEQNERFGLARESFENDPNSVCAPETVLTEPARRTPAP